MPAKKATAKFKPTAPTKSGGVKTSAPPVTMAPPRKPMSQGGGMVGGMPANFGVGASTPGSRKAAKSKKPARTKMY